jgi:uncharacterized membrane protein
MTWIRRILSRRAELDEAALVLPVLLLVSIGLINLAILGFAAVSANNAANYGARMGSVSLYDPQGTAYVYANRALAATRVGQYSVSVVGGGRPGDLIMVRVTYRVPNYFGGLARLLGVNTPTQFTGSATAYFRQEGW